MSRYNYEANWSTLTDGQANVLGQADALTKKVTGVQKSTLYFFFQVA